MVLAADVDERRVHLERIRRDQQPLDELVRALVDEVAVLEAPRLELVGVAAQVAREDVLGQERPLHPGREPRPSPAADVARLHLGDQRLRGELLERVAQALVPADLLVPLQRLQGVGAEVLGEQLVLSHRRSHRSARSHAIRPLHPTERPCRARRVRGLRLPRWVVVGWFRSGRLVVDRGGRALGPSGLARADDPASGLAVGAPARLGAPARAAARWRPRDASPLARCDLRAPRTASTRSGVRFSWKWWSTCMVGAPPQPPRHSTVLDQVNSPSAVVSPDVHPRERSRWSTISSAPRRAQETLMQTMTSWRPCGCWKYIE